MLSQSLYTCSLNNERDKRVHFFNDTTHSPSRLSFCFSLWNQGGRNNQRFSICTLRGQYYGNEGKLMAAYGMTLPSPDSIVMAFLILTVLFVMMGDMMDKLGSTGVKQARESQTSPSF
jgi:hypothetical protein